jgi:hypothetical protein
MFEYFDRLWFLGGFLENLDDAINTSKQSQNQKGGMLLSIFFILASFPFPKKINFALKSPVEKSEYFRAATGGLKLLLSF